MKYLAVASGAYSDYSINLFLRVADDFDLSAKVREFAAKTGMEWVVPKDPICESHFKWPFFDGSSEDEAADRRRRTREAGCAFDDALFEWAMNEKDAFFVWLKQQHGVEVVDYTEQSVGAYTGLVP